jgi:hypothetical protein
MVQIDVDFFVSTTSEERSQSKIMDTLVRASILINMKDPDLSVSVVHRTFVLNTLVRFHPFMSLLVHALLEISRCALIDCFLLITDTTTSVTLLMEYSTLRE